MTIRCPSSVHPGTWPSADGTKHPFISATSVASQRHLERFTRGDASPLPPTEPKQTSSRPTRRYSDNNNVLQRLVPTQWFATLTTECETGKTPLFDLSSGAVIIYADVEHPPRPDGPSQERNISDDLWDLILRRLLTVATDPRWSRSTAFCYGRLDSTVCRQCQQIHI